MSSVPQDRRYAPPGAEVADVVAEGTFELVPGIGQIYSIVDALLIFRQSRKCLHDNIADTIVVKA